MPAAPVAPSPYPGMGAALRADGCTFRVWAPNASDVFVAGDFTAPAWAPGRIALQRDGATGSGWEYWSVFVPGAGDGAQYRFVLINGGREIWRIDPYCRDATSSTGNSVVDDPAFDWGPGVFQMPSWNELVIYELHVGTFNVSGGKPGTFAEALGKLDYLRDLGVNAVEVMPAEDFDTETSMGYNPALLFAIDDAYGEPKAVQEFVKQAHARGIAVIFDVVYNHFGPGGSLAECLWRFDGWSQGPHGGIYFYQDERAITDYSDEGRPDFGRPQVRQYLRDNAMMWLHEYRADGLRFDSTINIRRARGKGADRGEIPEGWALLQWINGDKNRELPWNVTIAEDLQDEEWITKPVGGGGAGFDAQWDSGFFGVLRAAVTPVLDEQRDVGAVADALRKRYNDAAFQRVIYSESHDEVTERDGADLGRMPRKIDWDHPDSWPARKRSTLAAALVFTAPGIPMLFQGQEFLEQTTWTPDRPLDWSKAGRYAGIRALYRDLIHLRRNWQNNTRGLRGQRINVFHVNDGAKVIAFHRWANGGPGDDVVVVANFSTRTFDSYNLGFPRAGDWYLRFNSDWRAYCSDFGDVGYGTRADGGPNQGMPCSGNVGLGPYSAIVLSQ